MASITDHKNAIAQLIGDKSIVADDALGGLLSEWRGKVTGTTPFALAPASTADVAKILTYTYANNLAVVPQGGNTGLVGGQIPSGEILITLKRLRAMREVSKNNASLCVEAGLTLKEAQEIAETQDMLFPLSIGSEGSCQIGGIISTNAGGVNVLRYGNMRDLVLGLEVVLPDGTIWHGLNGLRKNNTGYDLKQLFIGGEGTLGIVTAAVVKLFPQPAAKETAYCAVPNAQAAVDLLSRAQQLSGGQVTSFELISAAAQTLTIANVPIARAPLATPSPFYVLLELSSGARDGLRATMENLLSSALEHNLITDAVIADNETQRQTIWALRHEVSAGMRPEGPAFKGDICVPINRIPEFLHLADAAVAKIAPGARVISFGHLGDGNIHYDVVRAADTPLTSLQSVMTPLSDAVLDCVAECDGSFSAEHGIGAFKRDDLLKRKDAVSLAMMRSIKQALDPKGLMNPGKLL